MKTFQEFISLAERYYDPFEKLPSGKTPLEKAAERSETEYKNTKYGRGRQIRQRIQTKRKVLHGADNPTPNRHDHPDLDVSGGRNYIDIRHKDTGIHYNLTKHGETDDGKHVYDVQWKHNRHPSKMTDDERKQVARDAKSMWDTHVQHRLPHGAILKNIPIGNPTPENPNKNTRAKLYQRAGFGEVGKFGRQFAEVGREPSPKQKKKGKKRLKPLSGDTTFDYD
jgi:hypothetical protein